MAASTFSTSGTSQGKGANRIPPPPRAPQRGPTPTAARPGTKIPAVMTIVLRGGPDALCRVRRITGTEMPEKVSVSWCGQNMHFERTRDSEVVEGCHVPVFRWSYNTAIAE